MIIDDEQRRALWRRSAVHMTGAVILLTGCALAMPLIAAQLQMQQFLRFPLGYFLVAHGLVLGIIIIVYWFISSQESADRETAITGQT